VYDQVECAAGVLADGKGPKASELLRYNQAKEERESGGIVCARKCVRGQSNQRQKKNDSRKLQPNLFFELKQRNLDSSMFIFKQRKAG
jgi:hypothetical protein